MARRPVLAPAALVAAAGLALSPARPCAAQPYADERWGPVPPPGKGLPPAGTPPCRFRQEGLCKFAFGPDRRFRVPVGLLHPTSVGLARGYGMERRGGVFVRRFPYERESGLLRLTWGGLRATLAQTKGSSAEPAPGDEATLQILFQSRHAATLDQLVDRVLGNEAPEQVGPVQVARAAATRRSRSQTGTGTSRNWYSSAGGLPPSGGARGLRGPVARTL